MRFGWCTGSLIFKMASSSSHSSTSSSALIQQLDSKSRDLIAKIVAHLKSQGNFDELRRDCLEELDKMEAFRQLNQRVESYVATFLSKQEWSESLSKNQIRDNLRKHVCASDALKSGSQRLVSQVLEKKSKSFQTRLEGVVQNYIYMEKEKERQPRYHSRYEPERGAKSFESKNESDKSSTSGKSSTISDINDIISQIPGHKDNTPSSKSEGSALPKIESRESLHQSTSAYHKAESSLPRQQVSGIHSKSEHSKFERKGDSTSSVETHKNTTPSKTNLGPKKVNPNKRVIPKITGSQSTGISPEKAVESHTNTRTKTPKPSYSPKIESPLDKCDPNSDVEKPSYKKPENMVPSLKTDIHRTSPSSHVSKSSHDTAEKGKHSEIGSGLHIHVRQKVEDKHMHVDTSKPLQENIKPVDMKTKVEAKPSFEAKPKGEDQERKFKDYISTEKVQEESKMNNTEGYDVKLLAADDGNKESTIEESLSQDSESDEKSDVSDVSSVHTSDLSSFDGEVSSDSKNSDEDDLEDTSSKKKAKGGIDLERRSKISGGNDISELTEGGKGNLDSHKLSKSSRIHMRSSAETLDTTIKRKRGRPRKEHSTSSDSQIERHGHSKQPRSRIHQVEKESSDGQPARHRSKRPIKKRRCYSPSSEGTREVCLPSKRSRVSSKD